MDDSIFLAELVETYKYVGASYLNELYLSTIYALAISCFRVLLLMFLFMKPI